MAPFYSVMNVLLNHARYFVEISVRSLVCLVVLAVTAPAFAQLDVLSDSANFGQVSQGETVSVKFQIRNSGTEPLTITGLEFSMPGMNARVKQEIAAGSIAEILINWDTSRLRGEVKGQAVLTLSDPQIPKVVLTLRGKVVPSIEILPKPAVYISQFSGEGKSASLRIRNNRQRQLKLVRLESMGEYFQAEYEVLEDGKLFEITITIPAETPIGRYRESLLVHTDDPELERIHLEINALVKADVFINLDVVDFGRVSRARIQSNPEVLDFLTQTFVINRREGERSINAVKSDIPFIWVKQEPEGRSNAFRLDAGLKTESLVNGRFEGQIILSTDDPGFPELNIPVKGEISD